MNVQGTPYRTIWPDPNDAHRIRIIDQRQLPHRFEIVSVGSVEETAVAIRDMWVRGAPLIGAMAAWGMYLAAADVPARCNMQFYFEEAYHLLLSTRPTAVNLRWALDRMLTVLRDAGDMDEARLLAHRMARQITEEDVLANERIGESGVGLIRDLYRNRQQPVHILTHCNAGWLATVDWGTATAPIYKAHLEGIPLHVWVDETRPRNQGASLTAWELQQMGVPHTLIVDNAGGHLMQQGKVDIVITGADRVDAEGYAANKIGTYLKALAAADNQIPFYIAMPSSTIDWEIRGGNIPVEERDQEEVLRMQGRLGNKIVSVELAPEHTIAANPSFDITPPRLITGYITDRGRSDHGWQGILPLFQERP